MYIERTLNPTLREAVNAFPAVLLTGPRQSGKTTLLRLIKTPKLYFLDPILVTTLTRQPNGAAALAGPMGGALLEGWVVTEAIKAFAAVGRKPDLYFWRSQDGLEVDLLILAGGRLHPVEIKLTATPTARHVAPLNRLKTLLGEEAASEGILARLTRPTVAVVIPAVMTSGIARLDSS